MKENNLLASVALFSELYNNENYSNVADILGEFIKGVVITENKWTVSSTELTELLEKVYEFKIPETVVKTTVRNRLKNIVTIKDGFYVFDNQIKNNFVKIEDEYNSILAKQNSIIKELIKFIELKENSILNEKEKTLIIDNLHKYLLDNGVTEKYSKYISAFVVKNQNNLTFTDNLNLIREGIILYQGIRYTADINELGKWNTELTIFLSTEHLFNALGYNGLLYKQIFDDFKELVDEINFSNRNKYGEKLIQLKYLEETKDEVEMFFQTAELIHKGDFTLDTSKPAMKAIIDGCKYASDIKTKKVQFEAALKQKGITLEEISQSIYSYPDFVVDDEHILKELRKESESRGRNFDENLCRKFFTIFTKINFLRKGKSKNKFEKIGYIFITGNRFALFLAHQSKVKFSEDDIPFAKDIDFITNKFWFKLKKGFSNKSSLPKSFDVVTKAQVILSSQLNQSVFNQYSKLQKQVKDGLLTREQAIEISYELREKPNKPEEITIENIDSSLDFLNNDSFFEDLYREKEKKEFVLQQTLKENEELQNEIKRRDEIERQKLLTEARIQKEIEKQSYSNEEWANFKNLQNKALVYFLLVLTLTILPIIIGFILKANKSLDKFMTSLGNNQYWIWAILTLVFLAELFGRSYLFNKEKVKAGWLWLNAIIFQQKLNHIKEKKFIEFENDFNNA